MLARVSLSAINDSGYRVDAIPSGLMAIAKAFESVSPFQSEADAAVHIVYGPCWDAVRAFLRRALFKRAQPILFLSDEVPTLVDVFDLWTLGPDDIGVWMRAYNSLRIVDLVRDLTHGHQLDDSGWFFSSHREEPEHDGEKDKHAPEELLGSLRWEGLSKEFRECFRHQRFIFGEQRVACPEPLSEAQWMSFFAGFCGSVFLGNLIALSESGQTSLVKSLLLLDSIKDRMPSWPVRGFVMLSQICGKLDEWELAEHCVSLAYERSPGLKDGYARLGWLKEGEKDWEGALSIMTKDDELDRLSAGWRLVLALVHGRLQMFDRADELIDCAYKENSRLIDGFARLGWLKAERSDWKGAAPIIQKDYIASRMSPKWVVFLAQVVGRLGDFTRASTLIEEAYEADTSLVDGYSRLSTIRSEQHSWDEAISLCERDREKNRLSPQWYVNLAQLYGRIECVETAIGLIVSAYSMSLDVNDGFARLGWVLYRNNTITDPLPYYERDLHLSRLSQEWKMVYNGYLCVAKQKAIPVYGSNNEQSSKYHFGFLTQEPNQMVLGPIQDDEALLLFSIIRCMRLKRIVEIGGLSGYSGRVFIEATGPEGMVYSVDLVDVPKLADNHITLCKNALELSTADFSGLPVDMVFFDCHDYIAQIGLLQNLQEKGIITDSTILALHDTNLHPKKYTKASYSLNGLWVHEPTERRMVNYLKSVGYDSISFHTNLSCHDKGLPFRHGVTVMQKFNRLDT